MNDHEITSLIGSESFPKNDNDVLKIIEKIALQEMSALKSANQFKDGLRRLTIGEGAVLEESVIEMAKSRAFDKNDFSRAPLDPTLAVIYHNNWEERQYQTTVRKDDIRKIIANKGIGTDSVVAKIIETLTNGRDAEDYERSIDLLFKAPMVDFSGIIGKKAKNLKGVLYLIRAMYNALKFNNDNLTTAHHFKSSTPTSDIRIAMSTDLSNLIDVAELASILNLEKVELMGKLNLFDLSYDASGKKQKYMVFVYDVNAIGCATRLSDIEMERVAKGRYDNAYLTQEDCYYFTGLFKAVKMDMTEACLEAEKEILSEDVPPTPTKFSITFNGRYCTSNLPTEADEHSIVNGLITADTDYHFTDQSKVTGTMGGVQLGIDQLYFDAGHATWVVNVQDVTGDIEIIAEAEHD